MCSNDTKSANAAENILMQLIAKYIFAAAKILKKNGKTIKDVKKNHC